MTAIADAPTVTSRQESAAVIELEQLVALALTVLIGMRLHVKFELSLGAVVSLAFLPIWLGQARLYRGLPTLLGLVVVAGGAGIILTQAHAGDGSDAHLLHERLALLISIAGSLGGLLWCRQVVGADRMAVAFGVGMVLGIPFNISASANQWRFTYSIPIAVLLLALVSTQRGNLLLQSIVCVGLGVVGLFNDSRSNSAMLLIAAVAIIWQGVDHRLRGGRHGAYVLVAWGLLIYVVVRATVLGGFFGDVIQAKTKAQIATSGGSLLLGGRPEMAASAKLITEHPGGLGAGTLPTYGDVKTAEAAMEAIGAADNNYVERYMFVDGVELHSALADYWMWCGVAGLALVVAVAIVIARGLVDLYNLKLLTVLTAYLAARSLWDLAFSPAVSGAALVALSLALFARPRDPTDASPGGQAESRVSRARKLRIKVFGARNQAGGS